MIDVVVVCADTCRIYHFYVKISIRFCAMLDKFSNCNVHHKTHRRSCIARAVRLFAMVHVGAVHNSSDVDTDEDGASPWMPYAAPILFAVSLAAVAVARHCGRGWRRALDHGPCARRGVKRAFCLAQRMSVGSVAVVALLVLSAVAFVVLRLVGGGWSTATLISATGSLCLLVAAVVTLPTTRTQLWVAAFGLPFERAVRFHRVVGRLLVACIVAHGAAATARHGTAVLSLQPVAGSHGHAPLAGLLAAALFGTVAAFAQEPLRRQRFEVFYYTHFLFVPGFAIAAVHSPTLLLYVAPSALVWLYDRFLRFRRSRRVVAVDGARTHGAADSNLVLMTLSIPNFRWCPGQYVFVNVPTVSRWQWHPASLMPAPSVEVGGAHGDVGGPQFAICFKSHGAHSWTGKVAAAVASRTLPSLDVRVDGPLGHVNLDLTHYDHVVVVAGGIGITPMLSIVHDLAGRMKGGMLRSLRVVHVVWAVRQQAVLDVFLPELAQLGTDAPQVSIDVHVTDARTLAGGGQLRGRSRTTYRLLSSRPNIPNVLERAADRHSRVRVCARAQRVGALGTLHA